MCRYIHKKEKREIFFSQGVESLQANIKENDYIKYYLLKETGQLICEIEFDFGLGEKAVEIAQITDVHINYCLEDGLEDDEVLFTKQCRTWLANAESINSIDKAMDVAQYFDITVITGDILDYLSTGAIELAKKHIFMRDPNVICTLGGHDITKQMQTGIRDKLSIEERYNILKSFWCNDIFYISEEINNKIIIVGLNNAVGKYYSCQIKELEKSIIYARKQNKFIFIFQHEPISTGNPKDVCVEPLLAASSSNDKIRDFYNGCIGNPNTSDIETKQLYKLITKNSDIIKGIFCGHYHSSYYTEIEATENSGKKAIIPQICAVGNPYFGHRGVITRIVIK